MSAPLTWIVDFDQRRIGKILFAVSLGDWSIETVVHHLGMVFQLKSGGNNIRGFRDEFASDHIVQDDFSHQTVKPLFLPPGEALDREYDLPLVQSEGADFPIRLSISAPCQRLDELVLHRMETRCAPGT